VLDYEYRPSVTGQSVAQRHPLNTTPPFVSKNRKSNNVNHPFIDSRSIVYKVFVSEEEEA
jgi:hypothetical protein